jgi:hypothetical protein
MFFGLSPATIFEQYNLELIVALIIVVAEPVANLKAM